MAHLQYNGKYLQVSSQYADYNATSIPITDIDGNIYTSVIIGTQEWMVENLKTTKYKDATPIRTGLTPLEWSQENGTPGHDGSYSWPNNDIINKTPYGALYNMFAVQNSHGLAPDGWNVPSFSDYYYLINVVGNTTAKIKETGTLHWANPNNGATNESGWTGLPTGMRYVEGIHVPVNPTRGGYVTRTRDYAAPNTWCFYVILQNDDTIFRQEGEMGRMGVAVRCMRYLNTEINKERIDSRWCDINAITNIWNDNDGGIVSNGTELVFDGTGTYACCINNAFCFPEKVHVTISVVRTSGSLIPFSNGIAPLPAAINATGTYEYDLDYTNTSGFYPVGPYISITDSFVGSITALSVTGKYE
jgi:uncharacterized protein (TIGR02145 family)